MSSQKCTLQWIGWKVKKKRKGYSTPFGVNSMKSQVLYQAAQGSKDVLGGISPPVMLWVERQALTALQPSYRKRDLEHEPGDEAWPHPPQRTIYIQHHLGPHALELPAVCVQQEQQEQLQAAAHLAAEHTSPQYACSRNSKNNCRQQHNLQQNTCLLNLPESMKQHHNIVIPHQSHMSEQQHCSKSSMLLTVFQQVHLTQPHHLKRENRELQRWSRNQALGSK